jgi:cobalt-zinc-cadmium efflux system outer membrane protein
MKTVAACILLLSAGSVFAEVRESAYPQQLTVVDTRAGVIELTLEMITAVVLQNNHLLMAAKRDVEGARAGIQSASALGNPKIEWHQGQWQPSTLNRQQTRGWGVSQPIENPLVRRARIEAATSGYLISGQGLAMTQNELVAQVHTKAYEALLHQSEAQSATETLALLEQVRDRIRVRVHTGEAPRYEMIKADAEVIHARERQQTATLQAEKAMLELNRMAAGRLPARWKLAENFHAVGGMPELTTLQQLAQQQNPELNSLTLELERAQSQLRLAKAGRWPGLELRYTDTREPDVRQNTWGMVVQVPLLDQRSGPIAEAQAEVERIRTRLEGRREELNQQIQLAWRSLEIARLRMDALSQGVVQEAEAVLRVAQAAYRFGERGILDVLDAQRVLRSVRSDLLQARFQWHAARITIDQFTGRFAIAS